MSSQGTLGVAYRVEYSWLKTDLLGTKKYKSLINYKIIQHQGNLQMRHESIPRDDFASTHQIIKCDAPFRVCKDCFLTNAKYLYFKHCRHKIQKVELIFFHLLIPDFRADKVLSVLNRRQKHDCLLRITVQVEVPCTKIELLWLFPKLPSFYIYVLSFFFSHKEVKR